MGMTRQTGDGGTEDEKGEYVKHSALGGGLFVAQNIGKMGRKGITLQPGHFTQLGKSDDSSTIARGRADRFAYLSVVGGEFVCGPGRNISYVHRMSNTRGHNPIKVALGYAGILNPDSRRNHRGNFALGLEVEAGVAAGPSSKPLPGAWRAQRDGELDRMRTWREERRKGRLFRETQEAKVEPIQEVNLESDDEDGPTTPGGRRRTLNARALNGHIVGEPADGLMTPMSGMRVSPGGDDSADGYEASEPTTPRSAMSHDEVPLEEDHDAPRTSSPLPLFAFPSPPAHVPNFLPSPSAASSASSKSMHRFPTPDPPSRSSTPAGPNLLDPIALSIHFPKGSTPKLLSHSRGNSASSGVAWGKRAGSPAAGSAVRGISPAHVSNHSPAASINSTDSANLIFGGGGQGTEAIALGPIIDTGRGRPEASGAKWKMPLTTAVPTHEVGVGSPPGR